MKKEIEEIYKLIDLWGPRLFLNEWTFYVKADEANTSENVSCYVEPDPAYFNAVIYVCENYKRLTKEEQEEAILHELIHCLSAEFCELLFCVMDGKIVTPKQANDAGERLTQRLTRTLLSKRSWKGK